MGARERAIVGLAILFTVAIVFVPVELALIGIDASRKKTPEEIVRLVHYAHVFDLIFLGVVVGGGWMIYSGLPTLMNRYKRALVGLASIACSLVGGFLVGVLTETPWVSIVFRLIR